METLKSREDETLRTTEKPNCGALIWSALRNTHEQSSTSPPPLPPTLGPPLFLFPQRSLSSPSCYRIRSPTPLPLSPLLPNTEVSSRASNSSGWPAIHNLPYTPLLRPPPLPFRMSAPAPYTPLHPSPAPAPSSFYSLLSTGLTSRASNSSGWRARHIPPAFPPQRPFFTHPPSSVTPYYNRPSPASSQHRSQAQVSVARFTYSSLHPASLRPLASPPPHPPTHPIPR